MPAQQLKDHYKILEVSPDAPAEDIKKAYRKLAFKYHPDTNKAGHSTEYFREVREAYAILSHPQRRKQYDNERWLAGMGNRAKEHVVVSPEWILKESVKLRNHMATVDTYRMSHSALYDYIMLLLSDHHMSILKREDERDINLRIIDQLLESAKGLKFMYMNPLAARLAELAGTDNELLTNIYTKVRQRQKQAEWEWWLPFFLVAMGLLMVLAMYYWGRK